jgi:hypothetical protein
MWSILRRIALPLLLAGWVTAQDDFQEQCSNVRAAVAAISDVTVNIVEFVPNGTNLTLPDNVSSSRTRLSWISRTNHK